MGWPAPQVLKPGFSGETDRDRLMAFEASSVIHDTTQVPLTDATLEVTVNLINLKSVAETSTSALMTRSADDMFYFIDLDAYPALKALLLDKTKYVGSVEKRGTNTLMRTFAMEEFAVDYGELEAILATKAYQLEGLGVVGAKIVWYDSVSDMSGTINSRFEALVFEGGSGTTPASRPEKVTHRGPVTAI